jgi:lysophospholipase L1-like esterase
MRRCPALPRLDIVAILAILAILATGVTGCGLFEKDTDGVTGPSPIGPPAANAAIRYTAIGASDANGVGSTAVCAPFTSCDGGNGYVPVLARQLKGSHDVTLVNLGIPTAVLSPAIQAVARASGRDVIANFIDQEVPFVPVDATLVTSFGGANDANAVADAIARGAAGSDVKGYINTQVGAFGGDYDRLVRGIRSRSANAFIIVINLPNLAALPYASGGTTQQRQILQQIAVGMSREANRQAGAGVSVLDLMCDPQVYDASRFSSDGFHPNDAGYAYLAQRLQSIVNGAPSSPPASCGQMAVVPSL